MNRVVLQTHDRMMGEDILVDRQALDHAIRFIKSWLTERYERSHLPGFVVAIAHQGKLLLNEAYGMADVERGIKLTPDHVFRIASHSKTFTATAIMQLAEEGLLRIDDYAADYLPWLKGHPDERWGRVTVRQLLSQGAGVIRDGLNADYWQLERPFPDAERFRREISETALILDNNTRMKYSNYGYTLLGLIIESASGRAYNDFVVERTVNPLGLKSTFPEYQPDCGQPSATGYSRQENKTRKPIPHIDTRAMSPATGFCSTARDLCTYFTAHMVGSDQLLLDESKKEMQRPHWPAKQGGERYGLEYGLGLMIREYGKRTMFGHSGGFPGFITQSMGDPEDGLVVVALTNAIDGPADRLVTGVYHIISYFQEHDAGEGSRDHLMPWEGIYEDLWGTTAIAAMLDHLVAANPDEWEPFANSDKLEYVEDGTFRINAAQSFGSEGELVHFHRKDGQVKTMIYGGRTSWLKAAWAGKQRHRETIGFD